MGAATSELEDCIRSQYGRLVAVVAVACGSATAAEDAVQDAFARAWERVERGAHIEHLAGWVVTAALNQTRSGWRHRQVEDRARPLLVREERTTDADALVDLERAVRALPARQREAVVLHHLLDLDVATVASLLGVSDSTVKTALARGRATLAQALAIEEAEAR